MLSQAGFQSARGAMWQEKDEGGNPLFMASPENADWKEVQWCGEEARLCSQGPGLIPCSPFAPYVMWAALRLLEVRTEHLLPGFVLTQ